MRGQQGELHLQAADGDAAPLELPVDAAQALGAHVREPQAGHRSAFHEIRQAINQGWLLPGGGARGAPVELHPFHLPLQPPLGGGKGFRIAPPAEAPGEGGQLGGQAELLPLAGAGLQGEASQQLFATAIQAPGAIGVRGVKEAEVQLKATPEGLLQQGVVPLGVVAPEELVSPGPGAHADARLVRLSCHDRAVADLHCAEFSAQLGC